MTSCGGPKTFEWEATLAELRDEAHFDLHLLSDEMVLVRVDYPDITNHVDLDLCWTAELRATFNGIAMEVEDEPGVFWRGGSSLPQCAGAIFLLDADVARESQKGSTSTVVVSDESTSLEVQIEALFVEPQAVLQDTMLVAGETGVIDVKPNIVALGPSFSLSYVVDGKGYALVHSDSDRVLVEGDSIRFSVPDLSPQEIELRLSPGDTSGAFQVATTSCSFGSGCFVLRGACPREAVDCDVIYHPSNDGGFDPEMVLNAEIIAAPATAD